MITTTATACAVNWCAADLPVDDGSRTHIGAERVITTSAGGEQHQLYVSAEMATGDPMAIRLEGATSAPMTPDETRQLIAALQAVLAEADTSDTWLFGRAVVR